MLPGLQLSDVHTLYKTQDGKYDGLLFLWLCVPVDLKKGRLPGLVWPISRALKISLKHSKRFKAWEGMWRELHGKDPCTARNCRRPLEAESSRPLANSQPVNRGCSPTIARNWIPSAAGWVQSKFFPRASRKEYSLTNTCTSPRQDPDWRTPAHRTRA